MKLGCGCGAFLVLVVAVMAGSVWVGTQMLRSPEFIPLPSTQAEGKAAQAKLFDLVRAGSGRSRGDRVAPGPIVISERELNAFVSRHLEQVGGLALSDIGARLPSAGRIELVARIPLKTLLSEPPLASFGASIPRRWLDRRVWLQFEAESSIEDAGRRGQRYLRFELRRFLVGRQAFPGVLARVILDPALIALLRWRLPDSVSEVTIEPGRAIVRRAS